MILITPTAIIADQIRESAPFRLVRIYGFGNNINAAVEAFFSLVVAGDQGTMLHEFFKNEARLPAFGSSPESWETLQQSLERGDPQFAAIIAGGIAATGDPSLGALVLLLTTATVWVRIVDPAATAFGESLATRIRRAFGIPDPQPSQSQPP